MFVSTRAATAIEILATPSAIDSRLDVAAALTFLLAFRRLIEKREPILCREERAVSGRSDAQPVPALAPFDVIARPDA
jgi:hypothetical protein